MCVCVIGRERERVSKDILLEKKSEKSPFLIILITISNNNNKCSGRKL